ncbi:Gfo/Idh/MocA family protein [Inquilinus sp.]|jgi:predicted dehydrogenase|uniref:Gfo/Idh/MocA family protein n=1 Tax=Inquilinus sp. TaxID=1932117 RepID=UPI0037831847
MGEGKTRVALVGTGHRGAGTWGRELLAQVGDVVEMVGLCDQNPLRLERARAAIGVDAPVFTDLGAMLRETRPDRLMVCSRDSAHDDHIVQALEAGVDAITEKPMTTTAEKCRRILAAEKRTGRRVDVTFNYRYAPTSQRIKQLLLDGAIGDVVSVDFHWYLDTKHGADYFRRWHAYRANSGSLFVHKATHHFDLLNWYLASEPEEVFARGELRHYGSKGPFRGTRCKDCARAGECDFHFDVSSDAWLTLLYEDPSREDGYVRDACVFREDIDIPDTMSAALRYRNGVQVSYSLNTFMPIEGHHLAFNGTKGRIEVRQFERQPWTTPPADEILLMRNFGKVEHIWVPQEHGGHWGGDPKMQAMLFRPGLPDPLGLRADARAGALAVLCGVAALDSIDSGRSVAVAPLLEG